MNISAKPGLLSFAEARLLVETYAAKLASYGPQN